MSEQKIAVLIPPYFWSSIPYDGLVLFKHLTNQLDVDLVMFKNDIRLNKRFCGSEKFKFATEVFKSSGPKTVKDWKQFYKLGRDYEYILSGVHLMPKHFRHTNNLMGVFPEDIKQRFILTDIGGLDILTTEGTNFASKFMLKGPIWKTWMEKLGQTDVYVTDAYVTGCPQYDYYLHSDKIEPKEARILDNDSFCDKYDIEPYKKILIVMPSNPASHTKHFNENIKFLQQISRLAKKHDHQVIIKTYPHDYVFYENGDAYSGVYKRKYSLKKPQYEIIQEYIEDSIVVESQDHFSALLASDIMLNVSGSHVAWETYLSNTQSFCINYSKQIYYGGVKYLPDYIQLPDEIVNIEVENIEDIFTGQTRDKSSMSQHISKSFSPEEILKSINHLKSRN